MIHYTCNYHLLNEYYENPLIFNETWLKLINYGIDLNVQIYYDEDLKIKSKNAFYSYINSHGNNNIDKNRILLEKLPFFIENGLELNKLNKLSKLEILFNKNYNIDFNQNYKIIEKFKLLNKYNIFKPNQIINEDYNTTILSNFIQNGYIEEVIFLLFNGADPYIKDKFGNDSIYYLSKEKSYDNLSLINILQWK